ncbi:MAG: helix-turn-helix domain-containing protein [Bacteroidales bacterium]|nr:helix-turn-helix domain-containing protein [Bacteroidales bacterium]
MQQSISINLSHTEFTELITGAINTAIDRRIKPTDQDELFTDAQARKYLKCSSVFLWKRRKEGKIIAVNAGKKILYPKSSLDSYLQLKTTGGSK